MVFASSVSFHNMLLFCEKIKNNNNKLKTNEYEDVNQ